jgi:hypothetical protein
LCLRSLGIFKFIGYFLKYFLFGKILKYFFYFKKIIFYINILKLSENIKKNPTMKDEISKNIFIIIIDSN